MQVERAGADGARAARAGVAGGVAALGLLADDGGAVAQGAGDLFGWVADVLVRRGLFGLEGDAVGCNSHCDGCTSSWNSVRTVNAKQTSVSVIDAIEASSIR